MPSTWMVALVGLAAMEIAVFRLAEPALIPTAANRVAFPVWNQLVSYLGRFLFYSTTTWAVVVLIGRLGGRVSRRSVVSWSICLLGSALGALVFYSLVRPPGITVTFVLEGVFVVLAVMIVGTGVFAPGVASIRVGVVVAIVPFVIHYYGQVALWFAGDEMLWSGELDELQEFGRSTVLFASLSSPYFFAPRPRRLHVVRRGPLLATMLVGLLSALMLTQDYAVAAQMAYHGLGIELVPGASQGLVALYIAAICAVTWTIVACATAGTRASRSIGVGLALIVAAGYAYYWPMQFPLVLCGLTAVAWSAEDMRCEQAVAGVESAE